MEGEDANEKQHNNNNKKQRICTPQKEECTTGSILFVNDKSLFDAAQTGELKRVIELCPVSNIDSRYSYVNANGTTVHDTTPLFIACRQNHKTIVNVLLNRGANIEAVNCYRDTSLLVACQQGHKKVVEILLNRRSNIEAVNCYGETSLLAACQKGHTEITKVLLERDPYIGAAYCKRQPRFV